MNKKSVHWLFTIAIIAILTIPTLVREGMFLDGITYSAVSKNMANGYGSPWNPHYTKTLYPDFHEQPPFVFIIQSYFFKVFGNAFYTERIFCLLILILTIIGITKCWRLFAGKSELREYDWLPVLLWITVPLVSWSYKNNLLENTMGVCTIFACFAILRSLLERKVLYLFAGSVLIVLAFISKGFAGLFPIVIPLLYAIAYGPDRTTMRYAGYLIVSTLFIAWIFLISFPELKNNILFYMDQQFLPALNNKREITVDNRLAIIWQLLVQLCFPLALVIFVAISQWRKKPGHTKPLMFLLIAITASIPLIISLKQRKYYLVPSIPFYVLSISFFVVPFVKASVEKLSGAALLWTKRISLATLSLVILFSIIRFGEYSRDKENLVDVYAISKQVPEGTILTTTEDLSADWVLVAYMARIGYLSLDSKNQHDYYLLKNNRKIETALLEKYEMTDLKLEKYILLKKK
jgi:hypothetical protein